MGQFEEAANKGPAGEGPVGVRVPNVETQEKGQEADEASTKAMGIDAEGGQDAETLGRMTEQDRRV